MVVDERPWHSSRRTTLAVIGGTAFGGALGPTVVSGEVIDPGTEIWSVTRGENVTGATVVDGVAYFAFSGSFDDDLVAVDAATGDELWTFETDGPCKASPQVVDGAVYAGTNFNRLHAVDAADGEEEWHYEGDDDFRYPASVADGTVYVSDRDNAGDDVLYAFDAETGDIRWQTDYGSFMQGGPVVVEDTVFLVNNERRIHTFDADSGDRRWSSDPEHSINRSPTVVDGDVYVSGGPGITVYDSETGSVDREFELESGTRFAPTLAEGRLFATDSVDGEEYVLGLSADDGEELWRTPVEETVVQGPPTVADGVLYFGDRDGYVRALDAATGERRWETRLSPLPVEAPLLVVDGLLYVGYQDTGEEGVMAALETDGDGSSVDSRVLQGALNHHDAWTGDPSPLTAPAKTSGSGSSDAENGDSVPGFGVGAGIAAVGGVAHLLRRHATSNGEVDR